MSLVGAELPSDPLSWVERGPHPAILMVNMSISARRLQRAAARGGRGQALFSLWPTDPTPSVLAESDTASVEVGVKFMTASPAFVAGIRFYKGASNTGTHTGSLWTDTGTLLASVTFTGETTSGWQTANFATPVSIAANTTYVASYFTSVGYYSADSGYFSGSGVTSGILSAPANTVSPNGVYSYGSSSTFPTQTFGATNYWVDVVVNGPVDTIPPTAPTNLAGAVSGSLVDLTWTASTDNIGVKSYYIYRGGIQIGTSVSTSYRDSTASPTTAYTYTVRAIDYGNNVSLDSNVANVTTGTNLAPTASFTNNAVGLTVYADGGNSSDVDGQVVGYAWDFGDSTTASGSLASHTYGADGSYTITLTVTDNGGATNSTTTAVSVAASNFVPNLINNPSLGGYPDATNTGVPSGTTLTASGTIDVTVDGTIIENLDITGRIQVDANNVTIRNCRITSGDYYPLLNNGTNLLVEDCEIAGTSTAVTCCIGFTNYTARRCNLHGSADGLKADSTVVIEDCYIHDLATDATTHNDGTQTTGGSDVTIRHNTYQLGGVSGINSCLQIGNEGGTNSNWVIEDNLFDGGGWTINASNDPTQNPNFQIQYNRFTRRYAYGVGSVGGATWFGNYYDDDGTSA